MQCPGREGFEATRKRRANWGAAVLRPYKEIEATVKWRPLSALLQVSEINTREIFQAHIAIALMTAKNSIQLRHHGSVIRMALRRRKGTAAQASQETIPIQNLFVGQVATVEIIMAEKTPDMMQLLIKIFHALVVDAEAFDQSLVFTSEALLLHAPVIPCDEHPASGLEDTDKFSARGVWLEPVKGLAGGDKIDAGIAKRGGFG